MPELWDLYDKDCNPMGITHPRGNPLPEGTYHLAVQIALFNGRGEIMLTRRSSEKQKYPGCWEIPGGCAKAGETSLDAACRELWEETGITAQPENLHLLAQVLLPTAHLYIYAITIKFPPEIALQPGETDDVQWLPLEDWLSRGGSSTVYLSPSWHAAIDYSLYPKLRAYCAGKQELNTQT